MALFRRIGPPRGEAECVGGLGYVAYATGELDSATAREVLALMVDHNRDRETTFVIATHDSLVVDFATRVVRLHDGRVSDGPVES